MANKTFVQNGTFTVADNDAFAFGASVAGTEIIRIQSGVTNVKLDANFERLDLSGALSDYKFVVLEGTGVLIKNAVGSATVATIPNINSLSLKIAFTNGSAELRQTGGTAFTLNNSVLPTVLYTASASDTSAAAREITLTGGNDLNSATVEISTLGTEHKFNATSGIDTFTASSGVDVFVGKFGTPAIAGSAAAGSATVAQGGVAGFVAMTVANLTANDLIKFTVTGGAEQTFTVSTETTVDQIVTAINADDTLTGVLASKDGTGKLVLTATDATKGVAGTFTDATPAINSLSPLATLDTISGFAIGTDKIDLVTSSAGAVATPGSLTRVADVDTVDTAGLAAQLATSFTSVSANTAGLVVISAGTGAGTYLYVNDSTPAFSATEDLFISLVGVTGTLGSTLIVSDFFA